MFPGYHFPDTTLWLTARLALEKWYPRTPESIPHDTGKTWQEESSRAVLQVTISPGFSAAKEATESACGV